MIEWKDEYSVNIDEIDEQHKKWVALLNEAIKATQDLEARKRIPGILKEFEMYSLGHFSTEEHYFDEFNYEGAEEHKREHQQFQEKIEEFKNSEDHEMETAFKLIDYLEDWLIDHIMVQDHKYIQCFVAHGLGKKS